MIVPMKKVSLAVLERDREISLKKLREAGVLHIKEKNVSSEKLAKLLDRQDKTRKALAILHRYHVKKDAPHAYLPTSDKDLVVHVLGLMDEKKTLQDQLIHLSREKLRVEGWGEFDYHSLSWLEKHGVTLVPYEFPRRSYDLLDPNIKLIVLSKDKRKVRAFAVGEKIPGLHPQTFTWSLSHINERIEHIHQRIDEIEAELKNLAYRIKAIEEENAHLPDEIEFETAMAGMEKWEDVFSVCWLSGFIPSEKMPVLKRSAIEHGWALIWDDPKPGDRPPTLIRSNAAGRIIKPVFSILGTIPGYNEADISFSFLIFFCLFFAMIFGDAGYGLLLLSISVAAGFAYKKKNGRLPDAAKLSMLLSFCTVAWGSVTGSWFAIPSENLPSFLRVLIVPAFNDTGPLAQFPLFLQKIFNLPEEVPTGILKTRWNIQFLCFTVAAIQLGSARIMNFIRLLPSLAAAAQIGWFLLMLGLYFLVLYMLLKVALPSFVPWLIGSGIVLNIIFSEQNGGNFFMNILKSFSNIISIFLKAVGGFADIISYIRLFAVGLAGGMIAQTFNSMAIPVEGFGGFGLGFLFKLTVAVFVLAVGHGLNLLMGALSVIVHGVRLNLLEYAGNHLGIEWSGREYKPFAFRQKK